MDKRLAEAWEFYLSGNINSAEKLCHEVLDIDRTCAEAWNLAGLICHSAGRGDEALEYLGKALRHAPFFTDACKNRADILYWAGRFSEARKDYEKILDIEPDNAYAHTFKGVIQLLHGEFEEGWKEYRWRLKLKGIKTPDGSRPQWDGESLDKKTILLLSEQGSGDTVLFARYALVLKDIYDCRVILSCDSSVSGLLKHSLSIDSFASFGEKPPDFDYYCFLQDVWGILKQDFLKPPAEYPYLHADDKRVEYWKKRLEKHQGFKIGIAWQGNPEFHGDNLRSFPLKALEPLVHLHNVHLFSLQKGYGSSQLLSHAARMGITDLGRELETDGERFKDTSAVMKTMDLVITPDTALAHISGSLGVRTWMALGTVPFWYWQERGDQTSLYPSMKLFRKKPGGSWDDVFQSMAETLKKEHRLTAREPGEYTVIDYGSKAMVQCRHGLMLLDRRDTAVSRSLLLYGEYSEDECHIFCQILDKGQTVVEAGAHIGAHTLALSALVGREGAVYAFEPQSMLYNMLCANMAINNRTGVKCFQEGLGSKKGTKYYPRVEEDQDCNFGGLGLDSDKETGHSVNIRTVDELELPACHLIKADVQGMELDVIKGAQATIMKYRPFLYLENEDRVKSPDLIRYLQSLDYLLYWHLPFLFNPCNYFNNMQDSFPGLISANMICIPRSSPAGISGFFPVTGPESFWDEYL